MKKIIGFISCAAVAALGFSACTAEDLKNDNENVSKTVTVHFGTENTDPAFTKATLTPDEGEAAFRAAWEENDEISISYSLNYANSSLTTGKWNGSSFEATILGGNGDWIYDAAYPVPDAKDSHVDFGPNRTQKGNIYNSQYDIMIGSAVAENADAGKDASGNDIVFKMERKTAIAYFHFTSDLDEAITKATLTVSGKDAAIASNYAYVSNFAWAPNKDCQSITITFPEEAPNAQNFQLWFNVLETTYESMSLTVETATKTFTISRAKEGLYEKGKLYKVKKAASWKDKAITPSGPTITRITSASEFTAGTYIIMTYDETYYVPNAAATNAGPELGTVVKTDGVITITPAMIWNATASGEGLEFTSYIDTDKKLWGAPKNDGIRINTSSTANNPSSVWKLTSIDSYGLCGYAATDYYLSTYKNNDWRNYNKTNLSETNKPANFFKVEGWVDTNHSISISTVEGGTLSASPASAEEGTEVTLTATPYEGYAFNNDWSVKDADETEITVADSKFTMPAKDVTVSGSFSKVDYTITKETCEGGSFAVKKDGVEVTKAQIGETITLEASAAEGYEFSSWTVTNESTSKTVYVSGNTFTMPGANVTVSANFLKADVITVYASLAELVAAGAPTSEGAYVTVTLTNEEITKFYESTSNPGTNNGIFLMVGTQEVEIYSYGVPSDWVIGGWISGTLTKCKWVLYKGSTWELKPDSWDELTYAAPCETPVITLNGAEASITCATEGATVRYTLDETDPTESSKSYSAPVTLTDGQTIKAKAFLAGHKSSEVASKTYSAGSTGGEDTPVVGTVMWEETWTGGKANDTPANYSQAGTTVYGGYTVAYSSSLSGTKLYNDDVVTGDSNNKDMNLLLTGSKNGKDTWKITGIPTGGCSKLTFTFETNSNATGRYQLSSATTGVSISTVSVSGTAKPFTATATITIAGLIDTFDLSIYNSQTSNVRLDNLKIVVAE